MGKLPPRPSGEPDTTSIDCYVGVLAAMTEQLGLPYSWGGGDYDGPSFGVAHGAETKGFDCSSLVRFAFRKGAGISLPRQAKAQYQATKCLQVADREDDPSTIMHVLRRGDLLFWGDADNDIHHVAMYADFGEMIEAPWTGQFVCYTPVRLGGDFYSATRPLALYDSLEANSETEAVTRGQDPNTTIKNDLG